MEKQIIKRKNLRISGYNYSSEGLYFITICIKDRQCILSEIINDEQKPLYLDYLNHSQKTNDYSRLIGFFEKQQELVYSKTKDFVLTIDEISPIIHKHR